MSATTQPQLPRVCLASELVRDLLTLSYALRREHMARAGEPECSVCGTRNSRAELDETGCCRRCFAEWPIDDDLEWTGAYVNGESEGY